VNLSDRTDRQHYGRRDPLGPQNWDGSETFTASLEGIANAMPALSSSEISREHIKKAENRGLYGGRRLLPDAEKNIVMCEMAQ